MDKHKHSGFTMIETILVMAIAGLIMLMVFIALPAVLRNSRDSQRRDDMLTFIQKLKDFQANTNRGALPTPNLSSASGLLVTVTGSDARSHSGAVWSSWEGFYHDFLPESWRDPSGGTSASDEGYYNLEILGCNVTAGSCTNTELDNLSNGTTTVSDHKLVVVLGASCDGEGAKANANKRKLAVLMRLESGGVYCVEN